MHQLWWSVAACIQRCHDLAARRDRSREMLDGGAELARMRLVHNPAIHRDYSRLKEGF